MNQIIRSGSLVLPVGGQTCLLTREQKITACKLVLDSGAQVVKTSTGFSTAGATVEDVQLLRETAGARFGVKAAGGIRDLNQAWALIQAGANRLGTSAAVAIMSELNNSWRAANLPRPFGLR